MGTGLPGPEQHTGTGPHTLVPQTPSPQVMKQLARTRALEAPWAWGKKPTSSHPWCCPVTPNKHRFTPCHWPAQPTPSLLESGRPAREGTAPSPGVSRLYLAHSLGAEPTHHPSLQLRCAEAGPRGLSSGRVPRAQGPVEIPPTLTPPCQQPSPRGSFLCWNQGIWLKESFYCF